MTNKPWGERNQAFLQAIRRIRNEAGLTQVELAEQLGKPQSYISKYESGERKLDYLEVLDICEACGVTPTRFNKLLS